MRFVALVLACVLAGLPARADWASPQPVLPQSALTIQTAKGLVHLTIELANTPEARERGLMFRRQVGPHAGMLFDFHEQRPVSFWMKNTLVPLDMIFIRADGRIASVAEKTAPLSLQPISSSEPVAAVLEIAGGRAAKLGIAPGDLVRHWIFGNGR